MIEKIPEFLRTSSLKFLLLLSQDNAKMNCSDTDATTE